MQRTPVIVAFFLAAAFIGWMIRYTDMTGGVETFELPSDKMAPIEQVSSPGLNPYAETSPILGSQAHPVNPKSWEEEDMHVLQFANNVIGPQCCPSPFSSGGGCICLTEQDKKDFAGRFHNKN